MVESESSSRKLVEDTQSWDSWPSIPYFFFSHVLLCAAHPRPGIMEPEECSWSKEAILTVLQKATESNETPLDKATIVKRCNAVFQGKRRKVSDNVAQNHLNQFVKTNQVVVVYASTTKKRTPYYSLTCERLISAERRIGEGRTFGPCEIIEGISVASLDSGEDKSSFPYLLLIDESGEDVQTDPPSGHKLHFRVSNAELMHNFCENVEKATEFMNEALSCPEEGEPEIAPRVLLMTCDISCAISVVVAFLMKYRLQSIIQAYKVALKGLAVLTVVPAFYVRKLIAYEQTLPVASDISAIWDEIQTETTNLQDWMRANNKLGKRGFENAEPTHLQWCLNTKPHYYFAPEMMPEFFSEYAKAFLRGERLQVVEYHGAPLFPLYIDLDIKCELKDIDLAPSLEDVLNLFLGGLTESILKFLRSNFMKKEGTELRDGEVEARAVMSISGGRSKFHHANYPKVNYKYGFHIHFPRVMVNTHQQKAFFGILLSEFASLWPDDGCRSGGKIPDFIVDNNNLAEIFDHPDKLRMLFSEKVMECKKCKSKKNAQKKSQGNKNRGQGAVKRLHQVCDECRGTGLRELRIYEFLGVYRCAKREWDDELKAMLGSDITGIRRRVELCSIYPTRTSNLLKMSSRDGGCLLDSHEGLRL